MKNGYQQQRLPNGAGYARLEHTSPSAALLSLAASIHLFCLAGVFLVIIALAGCSGEETGMQSGNASDYQQIALEFGRSLAARDYEAAHALTSLELQAVTSPEQLKNEFEIIVPLDWGPVEPVSLGETMTSWPGKQATDLGWVYVSLGGDVYSEAVTVIVMLENGEARIRTVEFGRP